MPAKLAAIDWVIILLYFLVALAVGLAYRKRAAQSLEEYFISGRSLPWWLAGTSMIATSFAADTPLAVTGLLARHGLAGNWFWWSFALGGMVTVFVYARLWRRAEVVTDIELVELRYGGKPAAFLRGFRAIYMATLVNSIIIGWVTAAMVKVLRYTVLPEGTGGVSDWWLIGGLFVTVGLYSVLSGLWGVVVTDFLQFLLALGGCTVLAFVGIRLYGGPASLKTRLVAQYPEGEQIFSFLPDFSAQDPWMPLNIFLIMLFVQWWASWYPGAEPGGGGSMVQRMASCRTERESMLATLWYQIGHYCLRPWPWILTAMVAMAHYPELQSLPDPGVGFPMLIRDLAPPGLLGLMLVVFFAAFTSTISTQVNWGASYLTSDLYCRFIAPDSGERRIALVSRLISLGVLTLGFGASWVMKDIAVDEAWKFLAAMGAGTGAVFMLRWFWWRINAWSEISAMIASLGFFAVVAQRVESNEHRLAIVALLTIVSWVSVTLLTEPEREEVLLHFYRKTRPAGPGWGPVAKSAPEVRPDPFLGRRIGIAVLAATFVYGTIPGVGHLIFSEWLAAVAWLGVSLIAGFLALGLFRRVSLADL